MYALRSYGYIVLHAVPLLLTIADNKVHLKYKERGVLHVLSTQLLSNLVLEYFLG